jgi:alkanesulfonate monooxygenase SsuD/methylene tetrahydromethanopterin reductase-like flavin-dependent oxidoreductase (luciferase family)
MVADGSYSRATTLDWCRLSEEAGFASIACGERITFGNQEPLVLLSAAAALTERIRIFPTVSILPMHSTPWLAKQMATLDVLSGGRLTLSVGTGGREHDYRAVGASFEGRNHRMIEQVDELREIWAGKPPFEGADAVGPSPIQDPIPVLAGVMGPKSVQRAAFWADGLCGSVVDCAFEKLAGWVRHAEESWKKAGKTKRPFVSTTCWYALGPDAEQTLESYVYDYMAIFGDRAARAMAERQVVSSEAALHRACEAVAETGCDELILVPASADRSMMERTVEALAAERWL